MYAGRGEDRAVFRTQHPVPSTLKGFDRSPVLPRGRRRKASHLEVGRGTQAQVRAVYMRVPRDRVAGRPVCLVRGTTGANSRRPPSARAVTKAWVQMWAPEQYGLTASSTQPFAVRVAAGPGPGGSMAHTAQYRPGRTGSPPGRHGFLVA